MVSYDKMILNRLLDSYEKSSLSVGKNVRTVNIEMRFTSKTIPAYFDESNGEYEQIHIHAKRLEEKDLITIIWKNRKVDHIIEKVRLNTSNISSAYEYLGRIPKNCQEEKMLCLLKGYLGMRNIAEKLDINRLDRASCESTNEIRRNIAESVSTDEIRRNIAESVSTVCDKFIMYLIQRIEEHKPVKEYISLDDPEGAEKLLCVIKSIEENKKPLYIREFSIKTLNDSKAFEKMENKVSGVFRKFRDDFCEMELSEILAEYNIYHTPNYIYLKGNGLVNIGNEVIDLSVLRQGIGISGDDIDRIDLSMFEEVKMVKKVITIENLTTFFRFSEDSSLIVYLGGYHNTSRRMLLKKIYEKFPNAEYYHFGDIDAGGYQIFYDLIKKTGIPFAMIHMDLNTLIKYQMYGKPLINEDRKRLKELAAHSEIADVVEYMLEKNVKLEQECILI